MTLGSFLAGVGFRTNTPSFEAGVELTAFVTGVEDGSAVARIGDSKLRISNAPDDAVDTLVRLRVEGFNDDTHVGQAEYLETVGESSF
ncbi:uncharacterized protein HHUB_1607 [Halobacterium hubeiense]|uniref:DUF7513 domain-containing protein n=1 Tax=Halobacterium hubeiense TaxID=1407499 RepID=A0A0U5GZV0_9EURY|nr:hypothetical protein [Halobacterium hubeiense]CQH50245.1 uncharacterized protein HHUB_1607 [Halobacterium hubeiense]